MKNISNYQDGFTLFETLLAITIISLVSVTSMYILFLSLNLRDMTLATTKTEESIRIFERSFRQAALGALNVTKGTNSIFLRSTDECWSFLYDSINKSVKYTKIVQTGCTPDANPGTLFFPASTKINSLTFSVIPLATGGNLVGMSGTVQSTLPLDTYQSSFSESFVNLMD